MVSRRTLLIALAATSGGCLQRTDTRNESVSPNATSNGTQSEEANTTTNTSESMSANNTTEPREVEETGVSMPDALSVNYSGAQSVLTVSGVVAVPTPCHEAAASATVSGRQVQLTVTASDTSDPNQLCSQVISQSPFSVRIPLDPPEEAELATIVLDPPIATDNGSQVQYAYPAGTRQR